MKTSLECRLIARYILVFFNFEQLAWAACDRELFQAVSPGADTWVLAELNSSYHDYNKLMWAFCLLFNRPWPRYIRLLFNVLRGRMAWESTLLSPRHFALA